MEVEELDTGDTVDKYRTALTALPAPAIGVQVPHQRVSDIYY